MAVGREGLEMRFLSSLLRGTSAIRILFAA